LSNKVVVFGGHLSELFRSKPYLDVPYEKSVFKRMHVLNFRSTLHFVFFALSAAVNINV